MASTIPSTWNGQRLLDYARLFSWTTPAIGVSGYAYEPTLTFLNEVLQRLLNKSNPWKWNKSKVPLFYTQPYQQDYPTNISMNTLSWLEDAVMIDINNITPSSQNIPPLTVYSRIQQAFIPGYPTKICWIPNELAITSTWPGPNVYFQNPLAAVAGGPANGGPGNNPPCAITDPNGNIQVVTTYGTTGGSAPSWPVANAAAGTTTNDGSVVWTVQDPNGVAMRLDRVASFGSNVFQINANYQNKPPVITTLKQNLSPVPDDLIYLVKQGFLAMCYKQVDSAKFQTELAQWLLDIKEAMGASDREDQEFGFSPVDAMQDTGIAEQNYPGWPGWSSGSGF
jgi:hypothetical protein